jgi:hypothetical protein
MFHAMRESYPDHHLQDSSESEPSDDEESACPKCGQSKFDNTHHLIEHLEEEHARRKTQAYLGRFVNDF